MVALLIVLFLMSTLQLALDAFIMFTAANEFFLHPKSWKGITSNDRVTLMLDTVNYTQSSIHMAEVIS
jgi:hypothetical protein